MTLSSGDIQLITNSVLTVLKTQTDRRQELISKFYTIINPQQLAKQNPSVFGPYQFNTTVIGTPYPAFGQVRLDPTVAPFMVMPYIDSWISGSGGVIGYNLGVYALTPVPARLTQHGIVLLAFVRGSPYKISQNAVNQSWDSSYQHNMPHNAVQLDDGLMEQSGN